MHLLDCYSLNCGLKTRRPFILEKFFPLDIDNFITLDTFSVFPSRDYDYWGEVINILYPILDKHDIKILLINKGDRQLSKVYDISGQLNNNQLAYVIDKSLLHLSVDGFSNHLASYYDKKIVSLFSDSPPQNSAPVFSTSDNYRLLTEEGKENFSYSVEETPKSINNIKPEVVASSVCNLLGIDFDWPFKTLFVGKDYTTNSVELVPSKQPIDVKSLSIDSIIMRMDLKFDEESLVQQLSHNKCSILTEKPINLRLLNHFKPNISQFVYLIGESDSKQYVEDLFRIGIQCLLMTEKTGKDLEELKFKYLDHGKIHQRAQSSKPKELEDLDLSKVYYKSNHYIIKDEQVFFDECSLSKSLPVEMVGDVKFKKVIDSEEFWKNSDKFYFALKG